MLRARGMLATEAKIAAQKYSTYSLRRGALTFMRKGGATLAELIDLCRHSQKSSSIVLGYIEPGHAGAKAMWNVTGPLPPQVLHPSHFLFWHAV